MAEVEEKIQTAKYPDVANGSNSNSDSYRGIHPIAARCPTLSNTDSLVSFPLRKTATSSFTSLCSNSSQPTSFRLLAGIRDGLLETSRCFSNRHSLWLVDCHVQPAHSPIDRAKVRLTICLIGPVTLEAVVSEDRTDAPV